MSAHSLRITTTTQYTPPSPFYDNHLKVTYRLAPRNHLPRSLQNRKPHDSRKRAKGTKISIKYSKNTLKKWRNRQTSNNEEKKNSEQNRETGASEAIKMWSCIILIFSPAHSLSLLLYFISPSPLTGFAELRTTPYCRIWPPRDWKFRGLEQPHGTTLWSTVEQ